MAITLRDKLVAQNRATNAVIEGMLRKIDRPDTKDRDFLFAAAKYAEMAGLDASLVIAQHLVETANQTSVRWNRDLNPGGVGIPADSTVQPFKIASADDAAAIMVQCVYALVHKRLHEKVPVPIEARGWFNGVWLPKVQSKNIPRVRTVDDLDARYLDPDGEPHATWAWDGTDDGDPSYADKVVARGNAFMPGLPASFSPPGIGGGSSPQPVFGRVPPPYWLDRPIQKAEGAGQNNLGKRETWALVLHRMIGTLWGTDGYFRQPAVRALTDYGVGVLHQDGEENDGLIIKWNDPEGYQSGWASGPVSNPYGDAAEFVRKYGVDAVNRYCTSIEISGRYYTTPFSAAAKLSVARLAAYHADRANIPWDAFPLNPKTGLSFILHHQGFTIGTGKVCSGDVVMEATAEIIDMAREIMRMAQVGDIAPTPTTYRKPTTYPWMFPGDPGFGQDHFVGKTEFLYLPVDVTCHTTTQRYATTGPDATLAGPDLEAGVQFHSDWCMRSYNVAYRLTRNGVRIRSAALWPRDNISTTGTVTRYDGPDADGVIVRRRPVVELPVEEPTE